MHGGIDTGGAVRAVESITTGLQWQADLEACWELGALLAAAVAGLMLPALSPHDDLLHDQQDGTRGVVGSDRGAEYGQAIYDAVRR